MTKSRSFLIPLILGLVLTACPYHGYKYNTGFLPTTPVNLEDFNTEYDDYNLSAPTINELFPLFFSSNRNSQGNEYDIVLEFIEIRFDKDNGDLYAGKQVNDWYYPYDKSLLNELIEIINTPDNEFGPEVTLLEYQIDPYDITEPDHYLALWATDGNGSLDIMVSHNYHWRDTFSFTDPVEVKYLNTTGNDAYPTVDLMNNQVFYCSDIDENFDIYCCTLEMQMFITVSLTDTTLNPDVQLCETLSSPSNDKCPSITENVMVFASDRPGGQGGYDLWYSVKEDSVWSAPDNFGPQVNTEYDEYRPIIKSMNEFQHDLLMFSSNRPGGKGGFDLYFVGVEQMVEATY